jgi:hypothetical protein
MKPSELLDAARISYAYVFLKSLDERFQATYDSRHFTRFSNGGHPAVTFRPSPVTPAIFE